MMKWLFVDPEYRGGRIGRRLVRRMARHALETGHRKFCWFVLKNNVRAQAFYRGVGATPDPDWDRWTLDADAIAAAVAEEAAATA
jgi:diamine N-acetyltransferase